MTPFVKALTILAAIGLATTLTLPQRQTVGVLDAIRRFVVDAFGTVMGTRGVGSKTY